MQKLTFSQFSNICPQYYIMSIIVKDHTESHQPLRERSLLLYLSLLHPIISNYTRKPARKISALVIINQFVSARLRSIVIR